MVSMKRTAGADMRARTIRRGDVDALFAPRLAGNCDECVPEARPTMGPVPAAAAVTPDGVCEWRTSAAGNIAASLACSGVTKGTGSR